MSLFNINMETKTEQKKIRSLKQENKLQCKEKRDENK